MHLLLLFFIVLGVISLPLSEMQQLVSTILALVTTFNLLGQNWETQSLFGPTEEVRIFENKAYVAHRGGLLVIDLDSGEESLIKPIQQ